MLGGSGTIAPALSGDFRRDPLPSVPLEHAVHLPMNPLALRAITSDESMLWLIAKRLQSTCGVTGNTLWGRRPACR